MDARDGIIPDNGGIMVRENEKWMGFGILKMKSPKKKEYPVSVLKFMRNQSQH